MTVTKAEQSTISWYNRNARQWMSSRESPDYWKEELDRFLGKLEPGTEILEIGPGGGRDARFILERGFGYLGAEVSPGMIGLFRERVPEASIKLCAPWALEELGRRFSAWIAIASLGVHIQPGERMQQCLTSLGAVLEPGARGLITAKPSETTVWGPSNGECNGERMRTLWNPAGLMWNLANAGFTVTRSIVKPPDGDKVGDRGWIAFLTRYEPEDHAAEANPGQPPEHG